MQNRAFSARAKVAKFGRHSHKEIPVTLRITDSKKQQISSG